MNFLKSIPKSLWQIAIITALIVSIPVSAILWHQNNPNNFQGRFYRFCSVNDIPLQKCKLPKKAYTDER